MEGLAKKPKLNPEEVIKEFAKYGLVAQLGDRVSRGSPINVSLYDDGKASFFYREKADKLYGTSQGGVMIESPKGYRRMKAKNYVALLVRKYPLLLVDML